MIVHLLSNLTKYSIYSIVQCALYTVPGKVSLNTALNVVPEFRYILTKGMPKLYHFQVILFFSLLQ